MKDIFVLLIMVLGLVLCVPNEEETVISDSAIRFRVIANSNSVEDQNLKLRVKDLVEDELIKLVGGERDVTKVRNIISENIDNLNEIVALITDDFEISFGYNYFPSKYYKGMEYSAGEYESLVVILGEGNGDNWWCVLFPPLCLLEAEDADDITEVEYRFLVKDLIDEYFYSK